MIALALLAVQLQSCDKPETVDVDELVVADFEYELRENHLTITNKSKNYTKLIWYFGDGEISNEESPTHVYQESGTVTLKLIAKNDNTTREKTALLSVVVTPPKIGPAITKVRPSIIHADVEFAFGDYVGDETKYYLEMATDQDFSDMVGRVYNIHNPSTYAIPDYLKARGGIPIASLLPSTQYFVRVKRVYRNDTTPQPIVDYSKLVEFSTSSFTRPSVKIGLESNSYPRLYSFRPSLDGDEYDYFTFYNSFVLDTISMKPVYPERRKNSQYLTVHEYLNAYFYHVCEAKLTWDNSIVSLPKFSRIGTSRTFWVEKAYPFEQIWGTDVSTQINKIDEGQYNIKLQISEKEEIILNLVNKVDDKYTFVANSNDKSENHMLYFKNGYEHLAQPGSDFHLIVEGFDGTDYLYGNVDFYNNQVERVIFQNLEVENYQSIKELALRLE